MEDFTGKIVWITGASSGIGEALAYAFAKKKVVLILSARREEELQRVKAKCVDAVRVELLPLDLEKTNELKQKAEWVISKMGSIDLLVNCAGISQRSFADDTSMNVYRKIMEINYFGTVQLSLAVLPFFLQRNEGRYIVMSSVTGKTGLPLRTAYSAAKHALEGFFSALRTETWRTEIKILVVRAGAVKTNIAANALTGDGSLFNKKDAIIDKGMSPDKCAERIIQAIIAGKKELTVGSAREKLFIVILRFFPGIAFNYVKRLANKV